ncbi:rCG63681 [Rattus norvegicus]|uniref:RCG63681 n=1 Tax=Rattus norvegicus TaxID=10116 RepID=A6HT86_RAT|nr:rCG63681 [Rattus norvegicus]
MTPPSPEMTRSVQILARASTSFHFDISSVIPGLESTWPGGQIASQGAMLVRPAVLSSFLSVEVSIEIARVKSPLWLYI